MWRAMEDWFARLWEFHATLGGFALALALTAVWAERRRLRRSNLDAVGFMPWTVIFLTSFLAAVILLGLAAREWLSA